MAWPKRSRVNTNEHKAIAKENWTEGDQQALHYQCTCNTNHTHKSVFKDPPLKFYPKLLSNQRKLSHKVPLYSKYSSMESVLLQVLSDAHRKSSDFITFTITSIGVSISQTNQIFSMILINRAQYLCHFVFFSFSLFYVNI